MPYPLDYGTRKRGVCTCHTHDVFNAFLRQASCRSRTDYSPVVLPEGVDPPPGRRSAANAYKASRPAEDSEANEDAPAAELHSHRLMTTETGVEPAIFLSC